MGMVVVMMGMVVGAVESATPVAAAVEVARQMVVYRLPLNGTHPRPTRGARKAPNETRHFTQTTTLSTAWRWTAPTTPTLGAPPTAPTELPTTRPPKLMAKHLHTDRPPREQIKVTYIATNITAADAKYIEATSIARDRPTCNVLPGTPLTCRRYWAMHYSRQKKKKALS